MTPKEQELRGALANLQGQVEQMRDMFDDEDKTIAEAMQAADFALYEFSTEDLGELLPDWAACQAFGQWVPNAQLCTRDGRKVGNAVLIQWHEKSYPSQGVTLRLAQVTTDAGNTLNLTLSELDHLFYPPRWVMAERLPQHDRTLAQHGVTP